MNRCATTRRARLRLKTESRVCGFVANRRVRVTARSRRNGRLFTGALQFGTEMAAPVKNIEDPMRHRSQELHQSANGSRANRRLEERDGSSGRPPAGRDRERRGQPAKTKTSYKERAVAKGHRLPLVGQQELQPAAAGGTKYRLTGRGLLMEAATVKRSRDREGAVV